MGGASAGDPDGSASAVLEVDGTQVTFAVSWRNIGAPTMGHIHEGTAGTNGAAELPLFMTAMPDSTSAGAGSVTVTDPSLVAALISDPAGYYLNLHTAAFPDGAVRGQLRADRHGHHPLDLLGSLPLQALMAGSQEVPGPGDPDGHGVALIRSAGGRVDYAFEWDGISEPIMGHIHSGSGGVGGPVVVPLFTTPVPENIFAIAGRVTGVDKTLTTAIRNNPAAYYTNLHTPENPAGAIRGQLFRAGHLSPR
jgi:CHRD domain